MLTHKRIIFIAGIVAVCAMLSYYAFTRFGRGAGSTSAQELFKHAQALYEAGKSKEAIDAFNDLLKQAPDSVVAHVTAGYAYKHANQLEQARWHFVRALELDPNNPTAHVALARVSLALGDYHQAFKEYEWRWHLSNATGLKRWKGEDPRGKTILLLAENGIGDFFQFLRFAQLPKQRGAKVIVLVPKGLEPLISLCPYIDKVVMDSNGIHYDFITSLPSLPVLYDITQKNIPKPPYIFADPVLTAEWKRRIACDKKIKVGLCWQSGTTQAHVPQGVRSIPFDLLAPLATVKNVSFYSLQKGATDHLKHVPGVFEIIDFGDDFDATHGSFMDTVALMSNLDLIITVDTSIAHLAGALAVPTWTLLPFAPDPRWMLDRSDTPWYPTMRLFRQTRPRDWQGVVEQVKQALESYTIDKRLVYGRQLHNTGDYASALDLYKAVVQEYPRSVHAQIALGYYYEKQNKIVDAMGCYKKAVACAPQEPVPHICLSPTYLALGDYQNWMREYSWRWHGAAQKMGAQWWDGSSLKGKKVLLLEDNALGDIIQFVRYAKLVKEQGAQVTVQVGKGLTPLFSLCCPYIDSVVNGGDMRQFDVIYPLQLLPTFFTTSAATIPQPPYIDVPQELVAAWHAKLKHDKNIKIGISWQTPHDSDIVPESRRSIELKEFAKIAKHPGVSVYSLQMGADVAELKKYGIKDFGPDFDREHRPFMDTAAIMRNLDLVVTIDTSIAHLAGALNVPVWVLLPYADCALDA